MIIGRSGENDVLLDWRIFATCDEIVGQVGNLRPIVNRPARFYNDTPGGLATRRRMPSCPTGQSRSQMNDSRTAILDRIRAALGRTPGQVPPPLPPAVLHARNLSASERVELFVRQFEKLNGKPVRVRSRKEAAAAVRDLMNGHTAVASNAPYLRECGIVDLPGVQTGITSRDKLRAACAKADFGITSAHYALADTGSFVMIASPQEARLISLLPPVHIGVIPDTAILPDLDELFTRCPDPAGTSSSMVLITGPSRTADIEQILVRGVHGPGEIYAVIVEEGA